MTAHTNHQETRNDEQEVQDQSQEKAEETRQESLSSLLRRPLPRRKAAVERRGGTYVPRCIARCCMEHRVRGSAVAGAAEEAALGGSIRSG